MVWASTKSPSSVRRTNQEEVEVGVGGWERERWDVGCVGVGGGPELERWRVSLSEERPDVGTPESQGPMGGASAVDGAQGTACEARRGMVGSVAGWWGVRTDLAQRTERSRQYPS